MLLTTTRLGRLAAVLVIGSAMGCAADIGTPDYSFQEGLVSPPFNPPPVPPNPFQPGDERLFVGYFYEGGRSTSIPINTVTTNYFIFVTDEDNPLASFTYAQTDSDDRVEGLISIEISLLEQPFWGGGIIWDDPHDLTGWTTMYVSFKSSDPSFAGFDLTVQSGTGEDAQGFAIDVRNYGYENDGEWHNLRIPLQDFIDLGFDISAVRSPFIISAAGGRPEDTLLIDDLYFTAE
jgi:hypothetical protein